MLHHISLAVADLERSGAFYDAALGALGYRSFFEDSTTTISRRCSMHRPDPVAWSSCRNDGILGSCRRRS